MWNVKYIRKAAEVIQGFVLIETLWNVKVRTASRVHQELSGINRNIVECKVNSRSAFRLVIAVLIETLWNVKVSEASFLVPPLQVLIETLWNVKLFPSPIISRYSLY